MTSISRVRIPSLRSKVSSRWQARVDLAACYR